MCDKHCKCCNRVLKSTAIEIAGGNLLITIPDMTFEQNCCDYELILTQPIPPASEGLPVVIVSNGVAYPLNLIYGNIVRGYKIQCRKKYRIKFCNDPIHFTLVCCD